MDRLRERYLNIALSDIVLPIMKVEAREITETQIEAANEAPPVKGEQLTAQTWFERGIIFQNGNNVDEALRCYTEAIRLDPNLDAAHNNLAVLLDSLKRYDEAEITYRKAIAIDPNSAQPYSNLGVLLEELERYAEAEEAYRLAIAKDPYLAQPYSNLGNLLDDLRRYPEAEEAYRQAIAKDPNDATSYNNLVDCHLLIDGYNFFSFMRASSVVKRHSILTHCSLRSFSQASTSLVNSALSSMRRSRHCLLRTLNSISAISNQLPCLGV
jgi:tetratricopeptide (TPR) repeat protein